MCYEIFTRFRNPPALHKAHIYIVAKPKKNPINQTFVCLRTVRTVERYIYFTDNFFCSHPLPYLLLDMEKVKELYIYYSRITICLCAVLFSMVISYTQLSEEQLFRLSIEFTRSYATHPPKI